MKSREFCHWLKTNWANVGDNRAAIKSKLSKVTDAAPAPVEPTPTPTPDEKAEVEVNPPSSSFFNRSDK